VRRGGGVEFTLWGFFTTLAVFNQRFVGAWAVVAAVFLGRDLDWVVQTRLLARRAHSPWVIAASTSALCVLLSIPEWSRPEMIPGVGLDPTASPVGACDFISRHGIRGRIFNHWELA